MKCSSPCTLIHSVRLNINSNGNCMNLRDRTGERVGRLTVLRKAANYLQPNGRTRVTWECRCDCGSTIVVDAGNLRDNHTTSCGCRVREICSEVGKTNLTHGKSKTREWLAWRGARDRCTNPYTAQYINYGARGIRICQEWADSFERFLADMGECPKGHSLDRVDVNGPYAPGNCRWATAMERMRNRTCTPRFMYRGVWTPLVELAEEFRMPYRLVYERVFRQEWDLETALTKPKRKRHVQTDVGM